MRWIVALIAFVASVTLLAGQSQRNFQRLDLSGEINGAPYRIQVPELWNGTLLVFVHGYRDQADHPGEVEVRTALPAPAALVAPQLSPGYALAGSAFKENGWAFEDGIQETKDLTVFFRESFSEALRLELGGND